MQVRDTPLRVNERASTVVLSVGAGGSGIYYGPSESAVKTNTAAPGAQVTITSPMYVQSQGLRDGPPADLDVLGEDTAPALSGGGAGLLIGTGVPAPTDGADGQTWLDQTTGDLWGPKAGGVWPAGPVDLTGPQGPAPSGNTSYVLLASAARTATTATVLPTNEFASGIVVTINVTALTAGASLTPDVQGTTAIGTNYSIVTGPAITATGLYRISVFPGAAESAAYPVTTNRLFPTDGRVVITAATADSVTYSISVAQMGVIGPTTGDHLIVPRYQPLQVPTTAASAANRVYLLACSPVAVPGLIDNIMVPNNGAAGSVIAMVYDSGEATANTRTLLGQVSGTLNAAIGWQSLGSPNVPVVAGQEVALGVMVNSTQSLGRGNSLTSANFATLAAGFLPNGIAKVIGTFDAGSFAAPASIPAASIATATNVVPLAAHLTPAG